MFEFLKKRPFSRWKFVQRILDRTGDSRRRRLSADGSSEEDAASVDRAHDDSNSLDCSERVPDGGGGGGGGGGNNERGRGSEPPSPTNPKAAAGSGEADAEAARAAIQRASSAASKARVSAQLDIPFHARGHYSIDCDLKAGSSATADAASSPEAVTAAAAGAAGASVPARSGSWHGSLREAKSKGARQMNKLRISFRKKPSTGQSDYNVLSDEHHHFDSSAPAAAAAAASDGAVEPPAGEERAYELTFPDAAALGPELEPSDSGDGRPRSQQAVADAVRRSFRKTTKYLRYGTQSITITKPTSLNWAASSTTKQTLI